MTNLTKQEFIKEIEGLGFEESHPRHFYREALDILVSFIEVFNSQVLIKVNVSDELVVYNTHSYDKALKLIKMILAGGL